MNISRQMSIGTILFKIRNFFEYQKFSNFETLKIEKNIFEQFKKLKVDSEKYLHYYFNIDRSKIFSKVGKLIIFF